MRNAVHRWKVTAERWMALLHVHERAFEQVDREHAGDSPGGALVVGTRRIRDLLEKPKLTFSRAERLGRRDRGQARVTRQIELN
jgi:hypothetical protein